MLSVAVLGAGTVGLSHALRLKEELAESIQVTVIAEHFLQDTTSWGSGGFWEPYQIAGKILLSYERSSQNFSLYRADKERRMKILTTGDGLPFSAFSAIFTLTMPRKQASLRFRSQCYFRTTNH